MTPTACLAALAFFGKDAMAEQIRPLLPPEGEAPTQAAYEAVYAANDACQEAFEQRLVATPDLPHTACYAHLNAILAYREELAARYRAARPEEFPLALGKDEP